MSDHEKIVETLREVAKLVRFRVALAPEIVASFKAEADLMEKAADEIEKLTKERDEAEAVVRFIASDYLELSHHKVEWQRNDWRKRCVKFVESLYTNKLED
jgi:wyosine [tRNA(Phe)-imidazoG37] synthetase (radical SAM superfamily)